MVIDILEKLEVLNSHVTEFIDFFIKWFLANFRDWKGYLILYIYSLLFLENSSEFVWEYMLN
jgi:hypothetical protein